MATRTIVTSQPDVECDVCTRRLLRGEQPDVFLAAGRRLIVCELCAPRATHEGWRRESQEQPVSLPPMRPRRGLGLLDRLRQVGRPMTGEVPVAEPPAGRGEPYDFLAPAPVEEPLPAAAQGAVEPGFGAADPQFAPETQAADGHPSGEPAAWTSDPMPVYLQEGVGAFNASEYPRRVAGVARSLGAPAVNVRSAEHLASIVVIVVAWELCWYRYQVDLSDGPAGVESVAQGTELSELAREEREPNAIADDSGALSLAHG